MMEALIAGARELGISLTSEQIASFELYYQELIVWNARMNLTAITDYEDVQVKHFLDSLTCVLAMDTTTPPWRGSSTGQSFLDVGSGGGFPGLVLQIACPQLQVTLVEATGKKVDFLRAMIARLELAKVRVVNARAEDIGHDPEQREAYDWVAARAVAELAELAEYMLPFCKVGGACLALKGGDITGEIEGAARAIEVLGGRLARAIPVHVSALSGFRRQVLVIAKVRPTPAAYPRRAGIAHKRPIR
jgi:16S rRNA (guanine527-N7)-methyltransferase